MPKYIIHGKTSSDFAAAMLNKPQDRYEMLLPFFEKFGIDVSEFVFTSGIDFNFDRIKRTPDSRKTHRYLLAAAAMGNDLSDAFFRAYFIDGRDLGDEVELNEIAREQGVDIPPEKLVDPALSQQIANDIEMSRQLRVDGVPYMVFAGQYAIAGAHMPEHIIPVIDGSTSKPTKLAP